MIIICFLYCVGIIVAYPRHKKWLLENDMMHPGGADWRRIDMIKCSATCFMFWWFILCYYAFEHADDIIDDIRWLHEKTKL